MVIIDITRRRGTSLATLSGWSSQSSRLAPWRSPSSSKGWITWVRLTSSIHYTLKMRYFRVDISTSFGWHWNDCSPITVHSWASVLGLAMRRHQPHQVADKIVFWSKDCDSGLLFLAVSRQLNRWLGQSVNKKTNTMTTLGILRTPSKSESGDFLPFRHLIRDIFRKPSKSDLWGIWSKWWGDMTWPTKRGWRWQWVIRRRDLTKINCDNYHDILKRTPSKSKPRDLWPENGNWLPFFSIENNNINIYIVTLE